MRLLLIILACALIAMNALIVFQLSGSDFEPLLKILALSFFLGNCGFPLYYLSQQFPEVIDEKA